MEEIEKEKRVILYVDDEESNLRIFKTAFRREYEVLLANNGREAIEMLRSREIPIIITDQKMPEMTGTQLLESTMEEFPFIIRIILTGFSDIESIIRAVNKVGIFKYVTKPWDRVEMQELIERALEMYDLRAKNKDTIAQLQIENHLLKEQIEMLKEQLNRISAIN